MSIYATMWSIQIQNRTSRQAEDRWVEVIAQSVPPHIGSPNDDDGDDPFASFLPPPVETDENGESEFCRAVVFVTRDTKKGTPENGQQYIDPLLVLSGKEYSEIPFHELLFRLGQAVKHK